MTCVSLPPRFYDFLAVFFLLFNFFFLVAWRSPDFIAFIHHDLPWYHDSNTASDMRYCASHHDPMLISKAVARSMCDAGRIVTLLDYEINVDIVTFWVKLSSATAAHASCQTFASKVDLQWSIIISRKANICWYIYCGSPISNTTCWLANDTWFRWTIQHSSTLSFSRLFEWGRQQGKNLRW